MVWSATTFKYVFDYRPGDVYWCTADCGWITGHSYLTYGPMVHGATQVVCGDVYISIYIYIYPTAAGLLAIRT